jgi:hypothetical protein
MRVKAIPVLILIAETGLAAYVALIVWLMTGWMVDDSQAAWMASSDWYIEAERRFGTGIVVALVFGGAAYLINRRWVAPLLPNSPSVPRRAAVLFACCIGLVAGAGAIHFAITRPFM